MRYTAAEEINVLALLAIVSLLIGAYVLEFWFNELPCPLCLLQRLGLLMIAFGFVLNVKFGVKMEHYGLSLMGAIYTAGVAMRQIVLHIVPDTGTYGPMLFNLHLYTWSFIASAVVTILIALELAFDPFLERIETPKASWIGKVMMITCCLALVLTLMNTITSFLICGLHECPEHATTYRYLIH